MSLKTIENTCMEIKKINKNFAAFTICGEVTPKQANLAFSNIDLITPDEVNHDISERTDMSKHIYQLAAFSSPISRRFKLRLKYNRRTGKVISSQLIWLRKHFQKDIPLEKEVWIGGIPNFTNEQGDELPIFCCKLLGIKLKLLNIRLAEKGKAICDPMEIMKQAFAD